MDSADRSWPSKLLALDAARGLASLVIVLWHWRHFEQDGDVEPAIVDVSREPFYPVLKLFYERGVLAVDFFFVLSGFIFFWLYRDSIEDRSTSVRHFWLQRFSRLYPLHLAVLLTVAALQYTYMSWHGSPFIYSHNDAYHFVLNLGLASSWGLEAGYSFNGPIWSVSVEVLLYLFFFIVARVGQGGPRFCLAVSLAAFSAYTLTHHQLILLGVSMFYLGGAVYHATVYLSSEAAAGYRRWIHVATLVAWLLVLVNWYVVGLSPHIAALGPAGKAILLAFPEYLLFPLTICTLALFEIHGGNSLRSIAWLGEISYASYLLHFPFQLICMMLVLRGVLARDFYLQGAALILFMIVLVAAAYACHVRFERPMQRLIRQRLQS